MVAPLTHPYVALETIRDLAPQLLARLEPMIYAAVNGAPDVAIGDDEPSYPHQDARARTDAILMAVADNLRTALRDELDDEFRVIVGEDNLDPFDRDWTAWGRRTVALAAIAREPRAKLLAAKTARQIDASVRSASTPEIEAALTAHQGA